MTLTIELKKVGVNAWFWTQPDVGLGKYLKWLIPALLEADPVLEITLISPKPFNQRPFSSRLKHLVTPTPFPNDTTYLARTWFEQITFPQACQQAGIQLAHIPYYGASLKPRLPTVVTVHDLIPMILPAYRQHPLLRLYNGLIQAATPRATHIITVSEASRQDILRHLPVTAVQVQAIYSAPAPHFQPASLATITAVKEQYQLPDQFILYIGGYDVRKNITTLLRAFAQLDASQRQAYPLVLAGTLPSINTRLWPDPRQWFSQLKLEEDVITPGWIAETDLPALYSAARLFVYPSRYEGFGFPVLEAMACGTAVLTTTATSLPELTQTAAHLVDPDDIPALAAALIRLCHDEEMNKALVDRGFKRVQAFSWRQTAVQTLQAYQDALRSTR